MFLKIRDTEGTFPANMGPIKYRNSMDPKKEVDIKKRWQEYAEELNKTGLNDLDSQNDVITHLEPAILECEIKWALRSITKNKASGGARVLAELFQILKDDVLNMSASLENSAVATGLENVSFHSNSKERQCQRMLKLLHNCTYLTC